MLILLQALKKSACDMSHLAIDETDFSPTYVYIRLSSKLSFLRQNMLHM